MAGSTDPANSGPTVIFRFGASSAFVDRLRIGRSAPIPAVRGTVIELVKSTLKRTSGPRRRVNRWEADDQVPCVRVVRCSAEGSRDGRAARYSAVRRSYACPSIR
jgi:hypothetical protein